MRKFLIWIGKVVSAGMLAILLLSVFFFFYRYTGVKENTENGATDFKWQPKQYANTLEEGFAIVRGDLNGYNNKAEVYEKSQLGIDTLVMGSSHMEAVQFDNSKNVSAILNELLPDEVSYNIGMSEHTIYTCVKNLNTAYNTYNPKKRIVIETSTVRLDIKKISQVLNKTYPTLRENNSGVIYLLQRIPAVKAIGLKLNSWRDIGVNKKEIESIPEPNNYLDTINTFVKHIRDQIPLDIEIYIIYHPNTGVEYDGQYKRQNDEEYRAFFDKACNEYGIKFVDMTYIFQNDYYTNHRLAHGFSNTGIGIGHLNSIGHKLIADELYQLFCI